MESLLLQHLAHISSFEKIPEFKWTLYVYLCKITLALRADLPSR